VWRSHQPLADLGISPAEAEQSRLAGKRMRPVSARLRRTLAGDLRRVADRGLHRGRARRRFEVLLLDRVAAVRPDLLELADSLDRCDDPDPPAVADLRRLLTDGCRSPLYNPDIHISELRAALYYLRARLNP